MIAEQLHCLSRHDLGGLLLVAYQVQAPGQQPAGIEVFDLSRPAEPRLAGRLDLSSPRSRSTHWVGYTGGRYAYLSTGTPDSRPRDPRDDQFPVIVDLTRPDRPTEAGRWWLPGTQDGDGAPPPARHERWDAGFRAHNINLHSERQHRAYIGYLDAGAIVLDTADVAAPRLVARGTPPGAAGSARTTCTRTSRSAGPGRARRSSSARSSAPGCARSTSATRSSRGRSRRSSRPGRCRPTTST
jgi:hypothetical protein